jgi:hypothetical protein
MFKLKNGSYWGIKILQYDHPIGPTLPYIHTGAGLPVGLTTFSISNRVYVLKEKHYF